MDALKYVGVSLLLASTVPDVEGRQPSNPVPREVAIHQQVGTRSSSFLNTESRIGEILSHPAFNGFAPLILPWDDRSYDEGMRLDNMGSLLPYHSHVVPEVVVNALNRMIDDVNKGKRIFFDFYPESQKKADSSKKHAGLFFFRGKPGAPFAIIAPGGGFSYVGSLHEGFPYAVEINRMGYNAFVLKYRTGYGSGVATQDLAAAISYIFDNTETLAVSTQDYSVWGSSAGARMAASIGSHGLAAFGGKEVQKPSTVVMAYTGHSDHSKNDPPTFVVVGEHDRIASPTIVERRIEFLRKTGTPVEYHKYENLGHGFGPGTGTPAEGWVMEATRFWERFIEKR